VCYGLGVLTWLVEIKLAVMLGIAATILLYFKPELRGLSERLTRRDLLSVLQFSVLSFIILPLLPNRDYGPYGALNPYQIWWMVVLIAGLGLAGYAALRLGGQRRGAAVLGLLGGLVSSTATTLAFSRHARTAEAMTGIAVIVIVLANLVVLIRLGVLAAVLAPGVLTQLYPVLAGGLMVGGLGAWYGMVRFHPQGAGRGCKDAEASTTTLHPQGAGRGCPREGEAVVVKPMNRQQPRSKDAEASTTTLQPQGTMPDLPMANPTELRTALGFGVLYAIVLLAAAWLSDWLGTSGLYAVALVSGLTDVDAITLTSLRLHHLGKLPVAAVVNAITLATLANLVLKSALVLVIGGWNMARHAIAGMGAVGLGLIVAWAILRSL
jgi:uncharacterized membrane protein (DUF4010 family)